MKTRIVLLCEDEQQACFVRRYLKKRGYSSHDIREEIAPVAKGSGEQWVRNRFPQELSAYRNVKSMDKALIVVTDADLLEVDKRIQTLNRKCSEESIPLPRPDEKIVFIVPKRNIETWLAFLRGQTVNEDDEYPKYKGESDCRDEVDQLHDYCFKQQRLPSDAPASLLLSCKEYKKL
ncbi:MAG: hypothetical protein ACAI35_22680 [Candidatus Methylacidiphilales bacterium]|nr:hypothetical protein [Candidatus Methylacidiphilales bacterium]